MFLASTFCDTIDLLIGKFSINRLKVLFIANPSDPFKNKRWVNMDRKSFTDNGCEVKDVDLRQITFVQLGEFISEYDIIHVCGGSAIYILKLLKDKKMFDVIKESVKDGRIIYTGTSAGSMIMAPNISFCADDEDEQEAGMVGKLKNMNSFGLSPFYLMCHAQEKYYIKSAKKSMNRLPKNKIPILFLNDNMALWIENDKIEFLKK